MSGLVRIGTWACGQVEIEGRLVLIGDTHLGR
jgi:hypothetical protein